jgi:hypothetical protein
MEGAGALFWGMVFGACGVGYFMYGRNTKRLVPLFCGIALAIFPYFVSDTLAVLAIGAALLAAPFLIREP